MIRRFAAVLSLVATGLTVVVLRDTDAGAAEPVRPPETPALAAVDEHYARMMVVRNP